MTCEPIPQLSLLNGNKKIVLLLLYLLLPVGSSETDILGVSIPVFHEDILSEGAREWKMPLTLRRAPREPEARIIGGTLENRDRRLLLVSRKYELVFPCLICCCRENRRCLHVTMCRQGVVHFHFDITTNIFDTGWDTFGV